MPITTLHEPYSEDALTPFHGDREGYAKLFACFVWIAVAICFLAPWLPVWSGHHSTLRRLPPIVICSIDLLALSAAGSFQLIFNRLSARIAKGGEDAVFMDGVRFGMATMTNSFAMLAMILVLRTW